MESVTIPGKRRIAKPLGVYVITAFDGVFIGLVPLVLLLVLDNHPSIRISEFTYYLSAVLRITVVAAALGAMMGENLGRRTLVLAVTAVSISMILNSVSFLTSSQEAGAQGLGSVGNITRGTFWIAINWWYFNRKGVVDYYRQNKDDIAQNPA